MVPSDPHGASTTLVEIYRQTSGSRSLCSASIPEQRRLEKGKERLAVFGTLKIPISSCLKSQRGLHLLKSLPVEQTLNKMLPLSLEPPVILLGSIRLEQAAKSSSFPRSQSQPQSQEHLEHLSPNSAVPRPPLSRAQIAVSPMTAQLSAPELILHHLIFFLLLCKSLHMSMGL